MSLANPITEFPNTFNDPPIQTLDELSKAMSEWRAGKLNRNEPIPPHIWKNAFQLLEKFSENVIHTVMDVPKLQFHHKMAEYNIPIPLPAQKVTSSTSSPSSSSSKVDFCEAKTSAPPEPLTKPNKIFSTQTLIVEFTRFDGGTMKIHTTQQSFFELVKAFFSGV